MNTIIRDKLIEISKKKRFITYQKLSDQCKLGLTMSDISQRNELAHLLGDISTYEFQNDRPLLSVVVFRDDTNKPGNGFFELANSLNLYNGSNNEIHKDKYFVSELNKCYDYWQLH